MRILWAFQKAHVCCLPIDTCHHTWKLCVPFSRHVLGQAVGYAGGLHPHQRESLDALLTPLAHERPGPRPPGPIERPRDVMSVLPTGGGKSAIFLFWQAVQWLTDPTPEAERLPPAMMTYVPPINSLAAQQAEFYMARWKDELLASHDAEFIRYAHLLFAMDLSGAAR